MTKRLFVLLICTSVLWISHESSAQSPGKVIKQQEVKELISSLSADSMMGRQAFMPGIKKTADYISERFKKIGLEPLDENQQDYLQRFTLFTLIPSSSALHINGQNIDPGSFFVQSNHQDINWKNLESLKTISITANKNFGEAFSKANGSDEDLVVLVNPAHKQIFGRYADYFGRGTETMNPGEGSSKLFVLTSASSINSGSFTYSASAEKQEGFNVAGKIIGTSKKEEVVVFSAHYDHLGYLEPVDGDSIANGADDNASGTTSVIMLAKYFKQLGPQPRTLIFVAFTAEEIGGYGSQYFSQQLDPDQVKAMFNIEMVGKPSKFGPNTAFLTGFEKTNMGKILQSNLNDTPYMIHPDPYPQQNLFYRSDNSTLARLGVPAHTISSVEIDKDKYYHTVDDELGTLNVEHLANMIRAIALSSRSIVDGTDTPTRVDTTQLK